MKSSKLSYLTIIKLYFLSLTTVNSDWSAIGNAEYKTEQNEMKDSGIKHSLTVNSDVLLVTYSIMESLSHKVSCRPASESRLLNCCLDLSP